MYALNFSKKPERFKSDILSKMDLKWKHPFTAILSGPTSSGKSTYIKKFLKHLDHMVDTKLTEIMYCAPSISQIDLTETGQNVKYHEGIPDMDTFSDQQPRLIILEDYMREINDQVVDWFTKGSHHCNHSVVRTVSINRFGVFVIFMFSLARFS